MASTPQRKLRPRDAARHVGLASSTLARLRCDGTGPAFSKLGRAVVYDVEELDRWVASRMRKSTSDPGVEPLTTSESGPEA